MESSPADQINNANTASDLLSAYKSNASTLDGSAKQEKIALDFFGRKKVAPKLNPIGSQAASSTLSYPDILTKRAAKVTYRYNEGFSNAVKLPIKISTLFDVNAQRM